MSSLRSLNDKKLGDSDESNYINVKTNRRITNLTNKKFIYLEIQGNYVCGTKEDIEEFYDLNNILPGPTSPPKRGLQRQSAFTSGIIKDSLKSKGMGRKQEGGDTTEIIKSSMARMNLNTSSEDEDTRVCRRDSVGTTLFAPQTDDVEDIPANIISTMCPFEMDNLSGKARVIKVLDADTIEILFFVRISELAQERGKGRARGRGDEKKKEMKVPVISSHHQSGFFSLFKCRFYGVDAAEHNTMQGQLATLLLEDYLESLNNIIYVKVLKFDKFGRLLIKLYSDKGYRNFINNKICELNVVEMADIYKKKRINYNTDVLLRDDLGIIALEYFGDSKDSRFKNLPLVKDGTINRSEHGHLLEKYKLM